MNDPINEATTKLVDLCERYHTEGGSNVEFVKALTEMLHKFHTQELAWLADVLSYSRA